ncbi:MAG: DUF2723 domain-containing protein [Candidatus Kapaibacterium sp.]
MNTKSLHRAFGFLAFAIALVTYMMTVQQTVPFWDCGEFTAAAAEQQVGHPPGAPLFLMVGKLFHLLPFGDPGWRVNLVSVFASAITILLLYLVTVQVIRNLRKDGIETFGDALSVYGSAFVGAAAYTFSDTFWFNAVESEVYASSTLFVALIVWLMMRWHEEADNRGHERYLLLIAYLVGLSTGVHLFSILTLFSIVLVVYFRRYEFSVKSFLLTGVIGVLIFGVIYPGVVKVMPAMLGGDFLRTEAREYVINDSPLIQLLALAILLGSGVGVWYGRKIGAPVLRLACSAFLLVIIGYSSYTHILLRSNANPPMNENNPKTFSDLTAYLSREQYGDAPGWPRRYQTGNPYEQHHARYGKWNRPPYKRVTRSDGAQFQVPDYSAMKVNMSGEMSFLWKYQIEHMYLRYFGWNFIGREGDIQDSHTAFLTSKKDKDYLAYNYLSGYKDQFPIRFFALPFIFGLIGLWFHFKKDPKMAFVYMTLFLMMGVLAAYAQNQQSPQPRERDYFYVGSFFVWCLWIGMGVYGIIDLIRKEQAVSTGIAGGIVALSLVLVPINMANGGWKIHNRAGNFIPFDYSYNVLQSLEKDAIVFTYGDNDTFPLWYMQDVAGIRRDVRVVNLSLGQTGWYIDQLKNREPWGAKKLPLSFSDESLRADESDPKALSPEYGEGQQVTIPVRPEIMKKYTTNPMYLNSNTMSFLFVGSGEGQRDGSGKTVYFIGNQHKLVRDIVQQTKFERPVYFSAGGNENYCGLDDYLRWEGLALRVCPAPQRALGTQTDVFDEKIMDQCLLNALPDDQVYNDAHYGFKFRNLNNMNVYYDEVHRRFMDSYRMVYLRYAIHYLTEGNNKKKTIDVLDAMNNYISPTQFPMSYALEYQIADMYKRAGANDQAKKYAQMVVSSTDELIANPSLQDVERYTRSLNIYEAAARAYQIMGNMSAAKDKMMKNPANNNDEVRVTAQIDQMEVSSLEEQGKYTEAADLADKIIQRYQASGNKDYMGLVPMMQSKSTELRQKANPAAALDTSKKTN